VGEALGLGSYSHMWTLFMLLQACRTVGALSLASFRIYTGPDFAFIEWGVLYTV